MELYFGHSENGKTILLNEEESHHLIRVRRAALGDIIDVTDGKGKMYRGEIHHIGKHAVELTVVHVNDIEAKPFQFHLVVAPTKNIDRIEWLLEKCTEIGLHEISFIQCRRSERKEIRIDRLEKIALSAMKQSMKAYLPKVNPMRSLPEFLHDLNFSGNRFICTMDAHEHLADLSHRGESSLVMIGPEGDFHPDEAALALSKGFKKASLGKERLRTETAAMVSCTIVNLNNK